MYLFGMCADSQLPPAVARYVEHLGLLWESQGLSRIAGRMIGLLTLRNDPQSLEEIARTLGVSKGSVSTDARHLAHLGLLHKVPNATPGDRRDYYVIAPDLPAATLAHRIAELEALQQALSAASVLPETPPAVRDRLTRFGEFHRHAIIALTNLRSSLEPSSPTATAADDSAPLL